MKKLHLDVSTLAVETFDTHAGVVAGVGTVRGLSGDACPGSYPDQCLPADSQDPAQYSCPGQTCAGGTCYYTCVNCGSAGCGTVGCGTAQGPTCSPQDASCVDQCIPPQ